MKTKPIRIEETLNWRAYGYTLRFWIESKEIPQGDEPHWRTKKLIDDLRQLPVKEPKFRPQNCKDIIEKIIEKFPEWLPDTQLNALEARQSDMGVVVYLVDFEGHG